MGLLVIGLMVVVFLISSNSGTITNNPTPGGGSSSALPTNTSGAVVDLPTTDPNATAGPTSEPAPRMTLEDFKKLYDAPNRPLIIDVRAKEVYDSGHIKGAISFPEADVDTRVGELPKDKLVIAYCQ